MDIPTRTILSLAPLCGAKAAANSLSGTLSALLERRIDKVPNLMTVRHLQAEARSDLARLLGHCVELGIYDPPAKPAVRMVDVIGTIGDPPQGGAA